MRRTIAALLLTTACGGAASPQPPCRSIGCTVLYILPMDRIPEDMPCECPRPDDVSPILRKVIVWPTDVIEAGLALRLLRGISDIRTFPHDVDVFRQLTPEIQVERLRRAWVTEAPPAQSDTWIEERHGHEPDESAVLNAIEAALLASAAE